jgi:salicylate hydroxylase
VLSSTLAADPKQLSPALEAYARARRARVGRVSREARLNLSIYEMRSVARLARNLALRALPTNVLLSRLDPVFKWQAG